MDSGSPRPAHISRIDRLAVALNVAILIFSTTAVYFFITGGRYGFWTVVSLVFQIYLAASSGYQLFRVIRKRITGS